MPSVSDRQKRFMELCKNAPESARGDCPPKRVAAEYVAADKRLATMKAKARRAAVAGE